MPPRTLMKLALILMALNLAGMLTVLMIVALRGP